MNDCYLYKIILGCGRNNRIPYTYIILTVYAPLAVSHMISGKAYARAPRGHMLSAAAVWTLLFEEFWHDISPDEQTQLINIFESPNPLLQQNDAVLLK